MFLQILSESDQLCCKPKERDRKSQILSLKWRNKLKVIKFKLFNLFLLFICLPLELLVLVTQCQHSIVVCVSVNDKRVHEYLNLSSLCDLMMNMYGQTLLGSSTGHLNSKFKKIIFWNNKGFLNSNPKARKLQRNNHKNR